MGRKREFVIGISVILIATLAFIFGWTNLFTVKSVSVSGSPNTQITKQVLLIADIKKGEKLARVEPRSISSKLALAGIDWIENVKISRNWINRNVNIDLSARVAIAKSGERYIDQGGVLFTSPVQVNQALLEIEAKDDTSRAAAVELFLALPTELRSKIATLNASTSNNFQFTLSDDLKINWGGNSNTAVKVKIYKALIALPENKKIKLMDLSDPTKPTVR